MMIQMNAIILLLGTSFFLMFLLLVLVMTLALKTPKSPISKSKQVRDMQRIKDQVELSDNE